MQIIAKKTNLILSLVLLLSVFNVNFIYSKDNVITIYYNKEAGLINKKIFGNNFIGYEPSTFENRTKEYYGYSDYGSGIWDLKRNKSVKEVIDLAKNIGLSIIRFPGGGGTHHYNWKNTIGKKRKHFLYGIDEFLKTIEEIGAEPVITVSYFTGNEQDAADLVEYLNAPCDGRHPWADKRAENGHPEPYGVKHFEFGNEVWHGNHRDIKKVLSEEYAHRYLKYYKAMKAVDPSIKIGVVLKNPGWNRRVLETVRDRLDFGIIHTYPKPPVWRKQLKQMQPGEIFSISLAMPILKDETDFQQTLKLLKEKSGRVVPLAITEYNGGFRQEKPVPYRHSLGTALINAELLRIFMKPEYKILVANYWQFSNSYWGMIKSEDDFMTHDYQKPINYIKRPNYYVYELYGKHFGDILIDTDVKSDTYDIGVYPSFMTGFIKRVGARYGTIIKKNLLNEKWKIKNFPGVYAVEKNRVLEINFKEPKKFNYFHSIKRVKVHPYTYYRLSGYIRTEGLVDKEGVCLEVQDGKGWTKTHSSAATEKIMGTTDWQYVDVIYKTLSDAESVNVIARRIGNEGPLRGKAFFKDVRLEKYLPPDTRIPYLSVNASKSENGDKVYLMVINKNMDEAITSLIELKDFLPSKKVVTTFSSIRVNSDSLRANAWILNGPTVDATNEKKADNVKVIHKEFEIKNNPFEFTFEPHSLTAIEIEREK